MKIEVGDRVTRKSGFVELVLDNHEIEHELLPDDIVKVERIGQNGWEVVEEKKELLTEEEREFLKFFVKYYYGVENFIFNNTYILIKNLNRSCICNTDYPKNMKFEGVETEREYTPKELRIGGINNGFRFRRT